MNGQWHTMSVPRSSNAEQDVERREFEHRGNNLERVQKKRTTLWGGGDAVKRKEKTTPTFGRRVVRSPEKDCYSGWVQRERISVDAF